MTQQRPAGWYPDRGHAGRFRYWDGERWSRVSSSDPGPSTAASGRAVPPRAPRPGPPRRGRGPLIVGAAIVALVAIGIGIGIWAAVLARRDAPASDGVAPGAHTVGRNCGPSTTELAAAFAAQSTGNDDPVALKDVRCQDQWASATTSTGVGAVFELQDGTWRVVAIGDHPCDQLSLPSQVSDALGC